MLNSASHASTSAIDVDDLPPRSRTPSTDELSEVMGGCSDEGESCEKDDDCCFGLNCYGGTCEPWKGP